MNTFDHNKKGNPVILFCIKCKWKYLTMVFLHTLFYSLFQIAIRALLENKDSETVLLFDVVVENGLCIVTHMNGRLWLYMVKKFYAIV